MVNWHLPTLLPHWVLYLIFVKSPFLVLLASHTLSLYMSLIMWVFNNILINNDNMYHSSPFSHLVLFHYHHKFHPHFLPKQATLSLWQPAIWYICFSSQNATWSSLILIIVSILLTTKLQNQVRTDINLKWWWSCS